jgi:hypothetical protein
MRVQAWAEYLQLRKESIKALPNRFIMQRVPLARIAYLKEETTPLAV